jgi:hypothetical protein
MKKSILTLAILGLVYVQQSAGQTSQTLSGTTPLVFTNTGTDTYNKTVIYHNYTDGLLIDLAKASDNMSSTPIDFRIDARGGGHNFFTLKGASGNLGIGTTNPQARLLIRTNTTSQGLVVSNCDSQGSQSHFAFTTADQSKVGLSSESYLNYYNDGKWSINSSNTSGTTLPISFSTDGTSRLFIKPDGNVGIGTSSPDAKLAVKGTIHAEEVKVDLNVPGPDYVFEKDYNLMSLEEIKAYIDKHKHLPEVPSAKEMETNGVNLSEMNMILLKKVEELTLHVIELKKRDELQQKEIEELKNRK